MFRKILIANRGEIALRVIRTCKKLGVQTVAVYSDPDLMSRPVIEADEAYRIGPGEPSASYLNIANILKAGIHCKADAVHPGYGFLAENPDFALACEESDITFIGPRSRALRNVANKLESKKLVSDEGIPVLPGSLKPITSPEQAESEARKIGFPVLIKAVFGGGGRGLRIVQNINQLRNSFERATAEAETGFGRGDLYIEKYLVEPRHIEVQIIAGPKGKTIHLGERECSLQRRYQKILEETPSPVLTPASRKRLVSLALKVAKGTRYENAGTIEFIRSRDGKLYYMETNKRIQVEHLITEQVTGVDIVEEQLRVASGDGLSTSQNEVSFTGAAINCRINAEDPEKGFTPTPGLVSKFAPPGGPGVRVDSALYDGCPVPEFYDSLIAKISCQGRNREEARKRTMTALGETIVEGVKTTIPVHQMLLQNHEFSQGTYHTQLLDTLLRKWKTASTISIREIATTYVALRRASAWVPKPLIPSQAAASKWRQALRETPPRRPLYVEGV